MHVRNLLMQNNFLMKQLLIAMNEPRNSMKLVFTVNFHVRFKSTSEFHPDEKLIHLSTFILGFPSCTAMLNAKST